MKIIFPVHDHNFLLGLASGAVNGGTAWLWHLGHSLNEMGHSATLVEYDKTLPPADLIIIQSEWYGAKKDELQKLREGGAKVVVIMGHFIGGNYFNPEEIEADLYVTTWKGDVVDDFEKRTGKYLRYWEHAYCPHCDNGAINPKGDVVFCGNTYPLRKENWLDIPNLKRIEKTMPNELNAIYRGAKVCPNIHGEFQLGVVSDEPSRLAKVGGYAINERTFQITGAGGLQVAMYHPLIESSLGEMVLMEKTPEDFKKRIQFFLDNPEERKKYIERGRSYVRKYHTYDHRIKQLFNWLNIKQC